MGTVINFNPNVLPKCWSPNPPSFYRCRREVEGKVYMHGPGYGFDAGYFDLHRWNLRWLFSAHTWDTTPRDFNVWVDEYDFLLKIETTEVQGKSLLEWIKQMRPVQFVNMCVNQKVAETEVLDRIQKKVALYF